MGDLINLRLEAEPGVKITQLFDQLELFSAGDLLAHTLFVQGQPTLAERDPLQPSQEQLLLIDPPADVAQRFRLPTATAVLFTSTPTATGLSQLQTQPGGVAHVRIGQHFLDLYTQQSSAVIYLPALGIICGGDYGSDMLLPTLPTNTTGESALETLRLLAQLVKQRRFQLYIPRVGTLSRNPIEMMERLAADVAYVHGLRRIVLPLAQRAEPFAQLEAIADSLLPSTRRTTACRAQNMINLQRLYMAGLASRPVE
ncbi:MAG: hypothetical protein KF832_30265 [Caldilineaceae bacterium]|nr:hypothetical protein [Caldilineaceae bacterium]